MKRYLTPLLSLGMLIALVAAPLSASAATIGQNGHHMKTTNEAFGHVGPRTIANHHRKMRKHHRRHYLAHRQHKM